MLLIDMQVGERRTITKVLAPLPQKRRLFDFGFLPNENVKLCFFDKKRGGGVELGGVVVIFDLTWLSYVEVK